MFTDKLSITKGSDKYSLIRLVNKKTKLPIDLTDVSLIQVILKNADKTDLILKNATIPATKAKYIKGAITFTAVTAGAIGNLISLSFNGTDSVATIISAWNTANPSNQVTHNGTGTEIIAASSISLTGGYNSYLQVEVWGNPVFGQIMVRMTEKDTQGLRTGINQTVKIVLDVGVNPGGIRTVGIFENKIEVIGDS